MRASRACDEPKPGANAAGASARGTPFGAPPWAKPPPPARFPPPSTRRPSAARGRGRAAAGRRGPLRRRHAAPPDRRRPNAPVAHGPAWRSTGDRRACGGTPDAAVRDASIPGSCPLRCTPTRPPPWAHPRLLSRPPCPPPAHRNPRSLSAKPLSLSALPPPAQPVSPWRRVCSRLPNPPSAHALRPRSPPIARAPHSAVRLPSRSPPRPPTSPRRDRPGRRVRRCPPRPV